jgi:hypothetical protein
MLFSLLEMLFLVGLAGAPGWFLGGAIGAVLGALIAVFIYGANLQWKLHRLERWLSAPVLSQNPPWQGVWREISVRVQRMLRQQEKLAAVRQKQLQDFLQAIQASPNGVILLEPPSQGESNISSKMSLSIKSLGRHFSCLVLVSNGTRGERHAKRRGKDADDDGVHERWR